MVELVIKVYQSQLVNPKWNLPFEFRSIDDISNKSVNKSEKCQCLKNKLYKTISAQNLVSLSNHSLD